MIIIFILLLLLALFIYIVFYICDKNHKMSITHSDELLYKYVNIKDKLSIKDMIKYGADLYNIPTNELNFTINNIRYSTISTAFSNNSCLLHAIFQADSAVYRYLYKYHNRELLNCIDIIRQNVLYNYINENWNKINPEVSKEFIDKILDDIRQNKQLLIDTYIYICNMIERNIFRPNIATNSLPVKSQIKLANYLLSYKLYIYDTELNKSRNNTIPQPLSNIVSIISYDSDLPYNFKDVAEDGIYLKYELGIVDEGKIDIPEYYSKLYEIANKIATEQKKRISPFNDSKGYVEFKSNNPDIYNLVKDWLYNYSLNRYKVKMANNPIIRNSDTIILFATTYLTPDKINHTYYHQNKYYREYRKILNSYLYDTEFIRESIFDYDDIFNKIKPRDNERHIIQNYIYTNINPELINRQLPIRIQHHKMKSDLENIKEAREYIDKLEENNPDKTKLIALFNTIIQYKFYNFYYISCQLEIVSDNTDAIAIYIAPDSYYSGHYSTIKGMIDMTKIIGNYYHGFNHINIYNGFMIVNLD